MPPFDSHCAITAIPFAQVVSPRLGSQETQASPQRRPLKPAPEPVTVAVAEEGGSSRRSNSPTMSTRRRYDEIERNLEDTEVLEVEVHDTLPLRMLIVPLTKTVTGSGSGRTRHTSWTSPQMLIACHYAKVGANGVTPARQARYHAVILITESPTALEPEHVQIELFVPC
jgi:hypothetical protein